MLVLTALALKWFAVWIVLLLLAFSFGPSPLQSAGIAAVVAVVSWGADRWLPFRIQGVTRWAIDGGVAALSIYLLQFIWPQMAIGLLPALFAGAVIGAIEVPLHFYLASRFGLKGPKDERDGIH